LFQPPVPSPALSMRMTASAAPRCPWPTHRPLNPLSHARESTNSSSRFALATAKVLPPPPEAQFLLNPPVPGAHAPGKISVAPSALGRMLALTSADVIPSERSESRDLWNAKPALTHLSTDPSTRCLWHLPRDDIAEGRFPRNERWVSPARQERNRAAYMPPLCIQRDINRQGRDIFRPYR
jgi:hypothetical protein